MRQGVFYGVDFFRFPQGYNDLSFENKEHKPGMGAKLNSKTHKKNCFSIFEQFRVHLALGPCLR
jgi:hypothetical protein